MSELKKMSDLRYMQAGWFALLSAAVAAGSRTTVANELGVSRTTVSLIMNGKYQGKTDAVAARVMAHLDGFECRYDGVKIGRPACDATSQAVAPTHNPAKLAHWSACQKCPKNSKAVQSLENKK